MIKLSFLILVLTFNMCLNAIGLQGQVSFVLQNQMGATIKHLFFSTSDTNYWSGDILSNTEKISDKAKRLFNLELSSGCNEIDILVADKYGSLYLFDKQNICSSVVEELILNMDGLESVNGINFLELIFRNEVGYSLKGLYIKPFDSIYWGKNFLQLDSFIESQKGFGFILPISNQEMIYDIKAVDIRQNSYAFSVDLYGGDGDIITVPIEFNDLVDSKKESGN